MYETNSDLVNKYRPILSYYITLQISVYRIQSKTYTHVKIITASF